MRTLLTFNIRRVDQIVPKNYSQNNKNNTKTISSKASDNKIAECCKVLNIPVNSKQDAVRQAFLELAKKYHPDSGSPDADRDKFITLENAFRTLTKHNTGVSNKDEVEKIIHDIKHTAPQHRQYLSYDGYGHGTIFQRQKLYAQVRAQQAAENVMEHRIEKAIASSDKTLMVKGSQYGKKHDIKTKYGFDRLVEDLIQESISKGEFDNLSGKGKPLKDQNTNPYVDFTTHKLNEVLISNGFIPEWITLAKEIDQEIDYLKEEIQKDRMPLGPYPLSRADQKKWERICNINRMLASSINMKINKFNLIVPLLNKQKFYVEFDKICDDILKNGIHSIVEDKKDLKKAHTDDILCSDDSFIVMLSKAIAAVFTFKTDRQVVMVESKNDGFFGKVFKAVSDLFNFKEKRKDWK